MVTLVTLDRTCASALHAAAVAAAAVPARTVATTNALCPAELACKSRCVGQSADRHDAAPVCQPTAVHQCEGWKRRNSELGMLMEHCAVEARLNDPDFTQHTIVARQLHHPALVTLALQALDDDDWQALKVGRAAQHLQRWRKDGDKLASVGIKSGREWGCVDTRGRGCGTLPRAPRGCRPRRVAAPRALLARRAEATP